MSRIGVFKNIDKTDFSPKYFPRRATQKKLGGHTNVDIIMVSFRQ